MRRLRRGTVVWFVALITVVGLAVLTRSTDWATWRPATGTSASLVAVASAGSDPLPHATSSVRATLPALPASVAARHVAAAAVPITAPAALTPKGPAPIMLDVCGVGLVPLALPSESDPNAAPEANAAAGFGSELPPHLGVHAYAQARAQLMAALHAGSPRQQAAAWLLDDDPVAASQANAALAALARTSQDSAIWRWAAWRCELAATDCAGLQAADWARADGSNAMPWLQLLQDNPAAAAEAWRGLAQASRLQSNHGALGAAVLQAWPADAPAYLSVVAAAEALGVDSAMHWPALSPMVQGCAKPSAGGPDAAQCDAVIRMLLNGSDNM